MGVRYISCHGKQTYTYKHNIFAENLPKDFDPLTMPQKYKLICIGEDVVICAAVTLEDEEVIHAWNRRTRKYRWEDEDNEAF